MFDEEEPSALGGIIMAAIPEHLTVLGNPLGLAEGMSIGLDSCRGHGSTSGVSFGWMELLHMDGR